MAAEKAFLLSEHVELSSAKARVRVEGTKGVPAGVGELNGALMILIEQLLPLDRRLRCPSASILIGLVQDQTTCDCKSRLTTSDCTESGY